MADQKQLICWLCKQPIKPNKVHFQGGQTTHPAHKKCLIEIKPSKRHGGGI
jgi:hypothetical protein